MKGAIIVIEPDKHPRVIECDDAPELETLQKLVGGYIEKIPHFHSIEWPRGGPRRRCYAFANEEGKMRDLPPNNLADLFWISSLQHDYKVQTCLPDYLVGTVIVLIGDKEFLEDL